MRRFLTALATMLGVVAFLAPSASATNLKFTFEDVVLPDGQVGEIQAGVKLSKNKADSVYCGYFTDNYGASLGYYFDFYEPAPTDPDAVLAICLAEFDERNT